MSARLSTHKQNKKGVQKREERERERKKNKNQQRHKLQKQTKQAKNVKFIRSGTFGQENVGTDSQFVVIDRAKCSGCVMCLAACA